jgi:hypothetical protein
MKTFPNENKLGAHIELRKLLEQAKPLELPMFPELQKTWATESALGQEIKSILAEHPEYYAEVRAVIGEAFPEPKR